MLKKTFFAFRFVVWLPVVLLGGCRDQSTVEQFFEFTDYASGSGMSYFDKKIYLAGDDMNYILITDTSLKKIDTLQLMPGSGRIPKNEKTDLEAVSIIRKRKAPFLLMLGSGSVSPNRCKGWLVNIRTRDKKFLVLDTFYNRILANGIRELNIEGLAAIPGGIILANRGNKSYPKNHLVFTSPDFWENQQSAAIRVIKFGASSDTASFGGVSGMDYSQRSDRLILTVSTENTYSAFADGAIGKSYLWIVDNISSKRRLTAMNPNSIVDLESIDPAFKNHKIESVCILDETASAYKLALVADDDKGTSLLFRINLVKAELEK